MAPRSSPWPSLWIIPAYAIAIAGLIVAAIALSEIRKQSGVDSISGYFSTGTTVKLHASTPTAVIIPCTNATISSENIKAKGNVRIANDCPTISDRQCVEYICNEDKLCEERTQSGMECSMNEQCETSFGQGYQCNTTSCSCVFVPVNINITLPLVEYTPEFSDVTHWGDILFSLGRYIDYGDSVQVWTIVFFGGTNTTGFNYDVYQTLPNSFTQVIDCMGSGSSTADGNGFNQVIEPVSVYFVDATTVQAQIRRNTPTNATVGITHVISYSFVFVKA